MAITTVAITGHVLAPDGSAPTSGRLVVKLSQAGSTLDGSESVRVATEVTEDLGTGGTVSFALCPNDAITPSGTYYLATFVAQLASGRRVQWAEKWQLDSADLTLDIGAVPRLEVVPGVAVITSDAVNQVVLAQAIASADAVATQRSLRARQPIEVPGALQCLAGGMYTLLRNRQLLNDGVTEFTRPSNYAAWYLSDHLFTMGAYPGLFTAAKIRAIVDHWASSYRPASHDVALAQQLDGSWTYNTARAMSDLHQSATLGLLVALAIERGDTTIWAAHGTMVLDCLDSTPRTAAGLFYSPAATPRVGFPFHDPLDFSGGLSAVSAYAAHAYQRLAVLADSTLQVQSDALISGLRTVRRSDGYYNISSDQASPDTIATTLVAAFGLGTEAECIASGNALADDYRDGLITQWGGLRFTPKPNDWTAYLHTPGSLAAGQAQNGGYFAGPWVSWAAWSMQTAGRLAEARALMTEVVEFFMRGSTSVLETDNSMPLETWSEELNSYGYSAYPAGVGSFDALDVPAGTPPDVVLELSGSASAAKVVPVPFHSTFDVDLIATASSTVIVALSAAGAKYGGGWREKTPSTFMTEKEMLRIYLSAETTKRSRFGTRPAYQFGGYLKAAITSGTTTQPISLRLRQSPQQKPRLLLPPQTWTDTFSGTSIDSRYIMGSKANWDLSGGALRCAKVYADEFVLAPMAFEDGNIAASVNNAWTGHQPRLILRWKDAANLIYMSVTTGGTVYVSQYLNGASSLLGTITATVTAGVAVAASLTVVGNSVTGVVGGVSGGPWTTTVTGRGLSGVGAISSAPVSTNAATWDNLTITPQATAQRTWITDSETIYTRTGTWSKSGATMLTTDTLAFKSAIHPDFSTQNPGVTAVFNSANWAAQKAGLCVRAASSTNMLYAVTDGTTVKVYDRNTTDILLATFTLATPLTNGVDATMTLRILNPYTIAVRLNGEHFYTSGGRAVAGSAGAVATTSSASSAQVTFKSMRIDDFAVNSWQPIPVGYTLTAGPGRWHAWNTDLVHAGNLGALVELRDHRGFLVDSQANGDDVQVIY